MPHPLLPPENAHDAIANLWPRVAAVEETTARSDNPRIPYYPAPRRRFA